MKRHLTLFILSFTLFILTGCTVKEPQLSIAIGGTPNEIDYWLKIIEEFQAGTSIKVRILHHPTDTDQRRQNLIIPLKSKEPDPDVFLMDVAWVGQFASSGWLLPLDPYIKKDNLDLKNFFPTVIEQIDRYNNTIIALPIYIDSGLLYYRKDLLNKYGLKVPSTWEELVQSAEIVQNAERKHNPRFWGFVWQGAQYEGLICNFLEFISSNNGRFIDTSGKSSIADQKIYDTLQFMKDLIYKYEISPPNTYTEMKEEEVRTYFENGNALFERNWPYAGKLHAGISSPVKGKWGMSVLPKFRNGSNAAALGGWHIGISGFSDKKDEAWELLKFLVSYETQKKFALQLGWNPGRRDLYSDKEIKKRYPEITVLKKAFSYSVARPAVPYYTQLSEILQKYVNMVIAGTKEPEPAMKEADMEINKIINLYKK